MTPDRKARLRAILEIVATHPVATQEELSALLSERGHDVTQSSVSRDVAELGLVKIEGLYRRAPLPAEDGADPNARRVARGVLQVDAAGPWLLVLHTPPGEANAVAIALDRMAWRGVAGTIAGDDTIFVAVESEPAARTIRTALEALNPSL